MRAVLLSTYELGHQPFGLASPAAWLRRAGVEVACVDLSRQGLEAAPLEGAALVGIHVPMHTATRLAVALLPRVRQIAPGAHVVCFGLYAPMNADWLRASGADSVLGGEFEAELCALAAQVERGEAAATTKTSLERLAFVMPDRSGLPPLSEYARFHREGESRLAGYTEATRGCRHLCRHCPVVPVYGGAFRVVGFETVMADIRQQVEAGARHITFGDPDFFNGPAHGLRIVEALHREFPEVSYDVTIKVEHLLRQARRLPQLAATGCALITSAVESFDDAVLERLAKSHTRADAFRAFELCREAGLALTPTFVSFTPWTTAAGFFDLCDQLARRGWAEQVAPIQLGIRLLVPSGSRLLELDDTPAWLGEFDPGGLSYRWRHPDAAVDRLCERVQEAVGDGSGDVFGAIYALAAEAAGEPAPRWQRRAAVAPPRLSEPWFCCSEPTPAQLARLVG